jgi:phosphoglycerate kinase
LENLRFHKGRSRDVAFAKELASLGDIYVNDAFELLIEHASTTIIAQFSQQENVLDYYWLKLRV